MSGSEIGGVSEREALGYYELMMLNRELAIEDAQAKADRLVSAFRRSAVFENTFREQLSKYNGDLGFAHIAEGGFVPKGYFDPHAELEVK